MPYDCLERRTGDEAESRGRWPKILKMLGLVVVVGLLISRFMRRSRGGEATTPPGSLWIGETLSYIKNPHQFFETRFSRYGPVFKTRILLDEVVCLVGPEAFTYFMDAPQFDREGAAPGSVQKLLNHQSLPLIGGARHQKMRSAVLQVFTHRAMEIYLRTIERITLSYLQGWERAASFTWLTEHKKMSASICDSLFDGGELNANTYDFVRLLDDFMAGLTAIPINLPWTTYGRALRGRDALLSMIDDAITRHRQRPYEDLLTEMLNARDEDGSPLSEEQLRAQMLHMHFAAYGGIFRVLTLMCMSLAQNPEVMERARAEVHEHAPKGPLDQGQLMKLAYLDQVTREVRRHNRIFASTFFDNVTQPFEYGGYHVPEGWKATGGIYTTMQAPHVFTKPRHFDPDRFGPDRAEDQKQGNSYIPQGGGSMEGHRCPAEDLTTILMKAVGVLLLRDYTWEATASGPGARQRVIASPP